MAVNNGVRIKSHRTKPNTDKTPQDKTSLDKMLPTTRQNPTSFIMKGFHINCLLYSSQDITVYKCS